MPELSKDDVGDAMARAFSLLEGPLDHVIDHQNLLQQALLYGPGMYKSVHHRESQQKFLSMSTHDPLPVEDDPVGFLRSAATFLPVVQESEVLRHLQHQPSVGVGGSSYPSYDFHNYPPQVDVPEIEECSTWMTDVLDDFPAIGAQELSPLVSGVANNPSFGEIPPSHYHASSAANVSPSIIKGPPHNLADDSSANPPSPTTPTTRKPRRFPGARAPILKGGARTSKPLLPRGSKRCQRASEKLANQVENMEQDTHVKRERQRRDDMSFKIATLECLLPPAGSNVKRDRASIVHDSVHYVKSLLENVEGLKKTFSELKLKKSTRSAPLNLKADDVNKIKSPDVAACASMAQLVEFHIQVDDGDGGSSARLEKCRCRPDYKSSAMKVLERLDLDVCRCTMTKMSDYAICVIIAKPRLTSSQVATSVSVVTALRSCVEVR